MKVLSFLLFFEVTVGLPVTAGVLTSRFTSWRIVFPTMAIAAIEFAVGAHLFREWLSVEFGMILAIGSIFPVLLGALVGKILKQKRTA